MKNIVMILLLVMTGGGVFAQGKLTDEKRKEFDAQKVAFFTQELDLSPKEAAAFWPLYNEMQKKIRKIEGEMRKGYNEAKTTKGLKEENYKSGIGKMLDAEQEMLNVKKDAYESMLLVLPASKLWKLSDAERKFHRQLFEKLRRECEPKK